MARTFVKICGIKTKDALDAAINSGAAFVGFNFFPPSPRAIGFDAVEQLARHVPPSVKSAAVVVDPDNQLLEAILKCFTPTFIQLHGKETPQRVAEIKNRTALPVIKALPISDAADFMPIRNYEALADMFLFDGKAPPGATLPGGNALSFDWKLMRGQTIKRPWFLAGGLNAKNAREAVDASGAPGIDVASGVESAPGVKDVVRIREFLALFG